MREAQVRILSVPIIAGVAQLVYGDGFKSVKTLKIPLGFARPRFEPWRLHFLFCAHLKQRHIVKGSCSVYGL